MGIFLIFRLACKWLGDPLHGRNRIFELVTHSVRSRSESSTWASFRKSKPLILNGHLAAVKNLRKDHARGDILAALVFGPRHAQAI